MTWFDKLRGAIYDEQDCTLFDEAIKCYKGGAYRMAYIATWIMTAASLKSKFKSMAEKDAVADRIVQDIEKFEKEHKPPDRLILNKAKEIGILDEMSFEQIEPILTMRNLFAHPYNVGPEPDEVRCAIRIAVDKVLSVPPLLRKPYIDDLLENLQRNRHYIDDLEEKVAKLAVDVTGRIASSLYPYFLKGLFHRLDEVIDDPDKRIFSNRLVWFSQFFIGNIKPDFSKSKWNLSRKFGDFPKAVSMILSSIDVWELIPESVQDSIMSYSLFPESDFEPWMLRGAFHLFANEKLTPRQEERFRKRFTELKITDMAEARIPLPHYVDRVIRHLSSHNWYKQNPAAELLWNAGPNAMKRVSKEMLEQLGRNILQSAEGHAARSIEFLQNALLSGIKWPESFVKGLLYECFLNDKNEFRCKCDYVHEAILIAIRCNEGDSMNLFDALTGDIDGSRPASGVPAKYAIKEGLAGLYGALARLTVEEKPVFKEKLNLLRSKLLEMEKSSKRS